MSKRKPSDKNTDMQRVFGTNDAARACEIYLQEQKESGSTEFFSKVEKGARIQDTAPVVYTNQPGQQRQGEWKTFDIDRGTNMQLQPISKQLSKRMTAAAL